MIRGKSELQVPDEDQDLNSSDFKSQEGYKSLDEMIQSRRREGFLDRIYLYKQRFPYLLSDYLGINMDYEIAYQTPDILFSLPERKLIKDDKLDDLKKLTFKELI